MEIRAYCVTGIPKERFERFDPEPPGDPTPESPQLQFPEFFGDVDALVAAFCARGDGLACDLEDDVMFLEISIVGR